MPAPLTTMHSLLERQLKRHVGASDGIPPEWQAFVHAVDEAYREFDADRGMLERSLELASQELIRANAEVRAVYARLINSSVDGIFAFDRTYRYIVWNPGMERLTGVPQTETIGKRAFDVFSTLVEHGEDQFFTQALAGKTVVVQDRRYRLPETGEQGFIEGSFAPLYDEAGEIIGGLGILRDITARKRVEAELEHRLRETLLLNRVIAVGTSQRDPTAVLQTVCQELARALHLPQAGVALLDAARTHLTVVADHHPPASASARGAIIPLANNPATQYVLEHCAPLAVSDVQTDPRMAVIHDLMRQRGVQSILIVPLLIREQVVGTLGLDAFERREFTEEEITLARNVAASASQALENAQLFAQMQTALAERKHAEEERLKIERKLLEGQKLESLGVLAGGIAHDFNNLLVSMLGNVGLALLDLESSSPARAPLEQIQVAAQRAAELTRQMLAYSGKGRLVIQRLDLNTVIEEMTQLLRVSISKSASLRFNLAPQLPAIEADPTQIRQIAMNLIVNASDAIGDKPGTITLSTGAVRADRAYLAQAYLAPDLPEGEYVYLEVSDTGVGMDAATQAKIFDPFFTTKFTGRGLGLAAVLGIVRGHKGAIKVYSEVGRGSTFRILFPSVAAPVQAAHAHATQPEQKGHGTVLIIDDEETVRDVTARMLERFGYNPLVAEDGRSGIELVRHARAPLACVLLDLTMPRLSGEETFRELRQLAPQLRVVLMSGYTEQDALSRFAGKGLAGFLQKPYTPQELREKLQSILEKVEV